MSEFAIEIPLRDLEVAYEELDHVRGWHQPPGRQYHTAEASGARFGAARAFFIKMEPYTAVYRHRDPPGVVDFYDTDHLVLATNPRAFICWDENGEHRVHLELGKRYRILDRGVLHWAVNEGDTDRIHLLIEYPKDRRRVSGDSGRRCSGV